MIARYTRRELADAWSDFARFQAMREVEVAACEEMEGPTEADLEAIRAATFTVEAIDKREKVTDHDTAAFVDVLSQSAGPPGRWIHYGLTSSDVLDTGLALQLRAVAQLILPGAHRLTAALIEKAHEHQDTCAQGAPTASTPSRRPSGSSSPVSRSRPTATRSGWSARRPGAGRRGEWRRRHLLGDLA